MATAVDDTPLTTDAASAPAGAERVLELSDIPLSGRSVSESATSMHSVELVETGTHRHDTSGDTEEDGDVLVSGDTSVGQTDGAVGPPKSTLLFASFNFVNSIIGAGIIGLPFALREAGFAMGIGLLISVGVMTDYSVRTLVERGVRHGHNNYEDFAESVFGKFGYFSIALTMFLMAYGAMLAYLIIIGDTVSIVVANWGGQELSKWSRRLTIFAVALTLILPLVLVKDMSRLAKTSFMSLVAVAWIVFVVTTRSMIGAPNAVMPEGEADHIPIVSGNFFPAIGIMAFAFVCHHSSFIVFNSLEKNTPKRWATVTFRSVGSSLAACLVLAIAGYDMFRGVTKGNLLNNYANDDQVVNVTRLFFSLTMVLTYPMESFVARHTLHAMLFHGKGDITEKRYYALSFFLWATSVLITMVVDDLGIVLELTGGCSATYIGFILPGAIFLKVSKFKLLPWQNGARSSQAWGELGPAYGLLVFGVIAFFASTVLTLAKVIRGEGSEE